MIYVGLLALLCTTMLFGQMQEIKSLVPAVPMDTLIYRHILSKSPSTLLQLIDRSESVALTDSIQPPALNTKADSLAQYYESIGYYQMALDELEKTELNTLDLNRRYADLLFRLGRYEESLQTLGLSVLPEDSTYAQLNLTALNLERLDDLSGATAFRARIGHDYPLNESNLVLLSDYYAQQEDFSSILTYLNDFLYFFPNTQSIRRIRGINNFRLGDIFSAIKDLKMLYNEGDNNPNTLYYLGHSYMLKDSLPQAREVLGVGAVVTDYQNAHILSDYAYVLFKENEIDLAHQILNKLDTLLNYSEEYLFHNYSLNELKGQLYYAQGATNKARSSYERALEFFPDSELTLYRLIVLENRAGNTKRESQLIDKYLKLVGSLDDEVRRAVAKRYSDIYIRHRQLKEQEFMNR